MNKMTDNLFQETPYKDLYDRIKQTKKSDGIPLGRTWCQVKRKETQEYLHAFVES